MFYMMRVQRSSLSCIDIGTLRTESAEELTVVYRYLCTADGEGAEEITAMYRYCGSYRNQQQPLLLPHPFPCHESYLQVFVFINHTETRS
jgi:hypothetical protein